MDNLEENFQQMDNDMGGTMKIKKLTIAYARGQTSVSYFVVVAYRNTKTTKSQKSHQPNQAHWQTGLTPVTAVRHLINL